MATRRATKPRKSPSGTQWSYADRLEKGRRQLSLLVPVEAYETFARLAEKAGLSKTALFLAWLKAADQSK